MKLSNISSTPIFYLAGVIIVGGLTLATVLPTDTTLHHYLAEHAFWVMSFFLISGFLGFAIRQNTVILFNFLACIAICSFLKQQNQPLPISEKAPLPLSQPDTPTFTRVSLTSEGQEIESADAPKRPLVSTTRSAKRPAAMPTLWMSNMP